MTTRVTISATPSAAIATNGTQVFTYPAGYAQASFVAGGATLWSEGLETLFTEGAGNFSVSYGASSATVTYLGSTSLPAGAALRFGPTLAVNTIPGALTVAAGTASLTTTTDVGAAFNQTTLNNQIATLAAKINALRAALIEQGVLV